MSELNDENYDVTFPNGDVVNSNRWNTALYTFIGKSVIDETEVELADYDHIFITRPREDAEDKTVYGNFIWKTDDIYEELRKKIKYLEWAQYLNIHYISDGDVQAFSKRHYGDIERDNKFPPEWVDLGESDEQRAA